MPLPRPQKNEDMELVEPKEGFDDSEQRIKSVVGTDELREFVMLPEWTVNNFTSTIKEAHFKTFRAIYPISQKNVTMTGWMM